MNSLTKIISLPTITDEGQLTFGESQRHIPFEIKRLYYIYDVEDQAIRGKHAHRETTQLLFCVRGSISLLLDDGHQKETVYLDAPHQGVLLEPMVWHEMFNFEKGTMLLVFASHYFDEKDYIRNYTEFAQLAGAVRNNTQKSPANFPSIAGVGI